MGAGTNKNSCSASLVLLSSLLVILLLPSFLCRAGPRPMGLVDQDVLQDIFGGNFGARYGDSSEEDDDGEWVDVPISLLPGDGDCLPIQSPEQEPKMSQLHEEYTPIEVIKATGNNKCDFYTATEGYECVPYYQCDEGTIITDGYGLIDIRFGGVGGGEGPELAVLDSSDLMCPGSLDVCCKDPDFVKPTESAPLQSTLDYGGQQQEETTEVCAQVLCCGSDGVTYVTPCDAPAGVECVSNDACPAEEPEDSQEEDQDVEVCAQVLCCGSDGVTYNTPCDAPVGVDCVLNTVCHADDSGEDSQEEEEEQGTVEVCHYEEIFQPVCGKDGKTYSNTGHASCEKAEVDCDGQCPCDAVIIEPYTKEERSFVPQCGRRNSFGLGVRIQNYQDDETQFGEWPHICAVLRKELVGGVPAGSGKGAYGGDQQQEEEQVIMVFQGGASLIAPGVVMTGAHKVSDFVNSAGDLMVRCGEWDTQTEGEPLPHQERAVAKVVPHPEYNKRNLGHTVALLFLETDFVLADHIDTICLPDYQAVFNSGNCFVNGWGKDVFGAEGEYQVVLKEVGLPMIPKLECQNLLRKTRLGRRFRLDQSFVCAGGELGKDACRGDGGGPLVCPMVGEEERYVQVGVVAWGVGCGEKDVPGVYTSVSDEVCWIDWAMRCQLGDKHQLIYGSECNAWLDGKLGRLPRREVFKAMTTCPDVIWPTKEKMRTSGTNFTELDPLPPLVLHPIVASTTSCFEAIYDRNLGCISPNCNLHNPKQYMRCHGRNCGRWSPELQKCQRVFRG